MQLAVLLKGILRGMGRETACEVMAKRRDVPHSGHLYSDLRLLTVPADFPEGDYVAAFEPFTIAVKHREGSWLIGQELTPHAGQPAGKIPPEQRSPVAPLRALRLTTDEPDSSD